MHAMYDRHTPNDANVIRPKERDLSIQRPLRTLDLGAASQSASLSGLEGAEAEAAAAPVHSSCGAEAKKLSGR